MNKTSLKSVGVSEPQTPKSQLALSAELRNVIHERNILTTRTKKKVIQALDEINKDEAEMNRKKFKERAILEILISEVNYLRQLELIINFFLKPIEERNLLGREDFQTLFGSIETIYKVNEGLLNELKKDLTSVANAFSNVAPFFKLYSVYAYDFKRSLNVLQKLQKDNSNFNQFLDMQETRPEVQSKLSALLITPIQRVPRYRLLLKQVLDYTSCSDEDYIVLKDSFKKIECAVRHINHLVKEQEDAQRMLELQRCLLKNRPIVIKPGRKIIKEGILTKLSQSGPKSYKRYFILMSDILMFCVMKNQNPKAMNSLKCSSILPLNKCKFTEVPDKGCFKIKCQNEELVLYDTSLAESQDWVKALKDTYQDYMENRNTLRKESTVRRPVKRKDIDEYSDFGVSPGIKRSKRIIERDEYENVFKNIANDSFDSESENKKSFFGKLKTKRNRKINFAENGDFKKVVVKDSLFPLREKLQPQKTENDLEIITHSDNSKIDTNRELFVFGSGKEKERKFTFKICNYFSNFTNCFKKALGFK